MAKTNKAGYTVVELMIVLAVTAVTAVSAFTVIRGQQSRTEFSQAIRDFETKITDVANDVSKGYFPNVGSTQQCVAPAGGDMSFTPLTDNQGSSSQCVFAGKVLQFNPSGNDKVINVITMAARRRGRDNKSITAFSDLTNNDLGSVPGLDESLNLLNGLRLKSVKYNNASAQDAVAFMTGFGSKSAASSSLTGAPETDVYWINCLGSLTTALTRPGCYTQPANGVGAQGIELCMEHGVGGRTARLWLGREGRQLSTTMEIDVAC